MSLSNEMNVITIPTHLATTAITFLTDYHNEIANSGDFNVWYVTNVLGCVKHLQELLDEHNIKHSAVMVANENALENDLKIVNKHLKNYYEMLLSMLSNDLGNTDLMDRIKAFKLLHPEVVNSVHKPMIDKSGSTTTGVIPFRFYDELENRGVNVIQAKVSEPNIEDLKGLPTLKEPNNDAVKVLTGMHGNIYAMQTGNTKNPNHNAKWQTVLFNLEQLIEELKYVNNNA